MSLTLEQKRIADMIKIDPEYYAVEIVRGRKLHKSVMRENRGQLQSNGCILCGAHRKDRHKCGL